METVRVLDPTLQLESRRVALDQLPGFDLPNEMQNALAHMAAVEGDTTKLLNSTDGALHVAGAGFDDLELALCGAGDKGLDDVLTALGALTSTYEGIRLADYFSSSSANEPLFVAGIGDSIAKVLNDIRTAVQSTNTILTAVYYAVGGYLKTHETA